MSWYTFYYFFWRVVSVLILVAVINAMRQMSRAGASRNWTITTGEVVDSSIRREPDGPYYIPVVKYRYVVEGQEYESSRIRFTWSGDSTTPWTASEVVSQYPVSKTKTIKVYYNPRNPSVSVLVPGVVLKDCIGAVIGLPVVIWLFFHAFVDKPTNHQMPENSYYQEQLINSTNQIDSQNI